MNGKSRVRPRDRDTILQSLGAGVVPRRGHHLIQVGRSAELHAMIGDVERVADGGSAIRLVIGEYGSGKTFFLHLVRSVAHEQGLVTLHADLAPDRRLHASGGQARTLYAELTRNAATRTAPEGGALPSIVERFISDARRAADGAGQSTDEVIRERLTSLSELVGGYDFAKVIAAYWRGYSEGNDDLQAAAIRWLRGEYTTKTDARRDLDVREFVDDKRVYDQLKLLARFVVLSGYSGLLVALDEMVNLYKLASTQARNNNYEQILRIFNDCLQGGADSIAFLMGGTPEFLMDTRRGLYSYEALRSRLQENTFAGDGLRDLSGPVVRLPNLTPEELYVLLGKLRHVHAAGDPEKYVVPDEGLTAFMEYCQQQIGAEYFRTPRNTIKSFVQLLQVLGQNPDADWRELLNAVQLERDRDAGVGGVASDDTEDDGDDLAQFQL